jgi:threonine aldolase
MDGARIFNAAAALNVPVADLAGPVDSLSFCLSKGLSAPVGSLVCGRKTFIQKARRNRKVLGGGMRQAGVIAAAGIVALQEMTDRLMEDHRNARRLAEGLSAMRRARIDPERIKTNIVYVNLDPEGRPSTEIVARLTDAGVRVGATGPYQFRAVTHYGISEEDIDRALKAFAVILD